MSRKQWGHGFYRGAKSAQTENKTLVGLWFHTRDEKGIIEWQGLVTKCIHENQYTVQLFSWWDGSPTIQKIIPFENMKEWDFYNSAKAMRWQYAKDSGKRDDFEHLSLVAPVELLERIMETMKDS